MVVTTQRRSARRRGLVYVDRGLVRLQAVRRLITVKMNILFYFILTFLSHYTEVWGILSLLFVCYILRES